MRFLDFLTLLVLFALLLGGIYFLWLNLPTESVEFREFKANISRDLPLESSQFYPNMRYPDSKISYFLSESCSAKRRANFEEAIEILEDKTILSFYKSDNPEINITCSNLALEPSEKGHFIAGEGGPAYILNSSRYSIIMFGKVALYRSDNCAVPRVAVHELLHALGFDHNANASSIMFPVTNCEQKIDREIIDEIRRLYSQPAVSDLLVESVTANKSGRYLNFEVTTANYGLKDAGGFSLDLIVDGEVIKSFEIENLNMGAKRVLTVSNLRVPRNTKEISLVIESSEQEITKENNVVVIGLVQSS